MTNSFVSKRIFQLLVQHLIDIEEEKTNVLEKYYPDWTNERTDFQELLDNYINVVENYVLNEAAVDNTASDECPFVIIGSLVSIKDPLTDEINEIRVISPFRGIIDFTLDSASYLSPIGRAVLLKKANEEVIVETPMGKFNYQIKAITLPKDIFQFY